MRTKLRSKVTLLFMTLGMLIASAGVALASTVDVTSVVDVTTPTGAVTLQPGQSENITINLRVSGAQAGNATFEVYRDWTLNYDSTTNTYSFAGSNPQEFAVPVRPPGSAATNLSTTGTVKVADGVPASATAKTLTVSVFDITNSNTSGGKLEAGTSATYSVTVTDPPDTTAPQVTAIARADANPTNTTDDVSWDVTFSEPVTGVDRSDFQLASTGLGGSPAILADPDGVTGSGANYTVTASSGTGDGTLGLNLVDDNSIKDGANNVLVGASSADGGFTGEVYTIDRTRPTVSVTALKGVDPNYTDGAYSEGTWTNKDVKVTFTCVNDTGGSDLSATSGNDVQQFTTESASVSGTVATFGATGATCDDAAGNSANSDLDFTVKIDKTAPSIGTVSAVKGDAPDFTGATAYTANTWTNKDVKVSWSCTDTLSGPVNANGSQTVIDEGAAGSVTPSCADNAGTTANGTAFSPIKIDKTKPTVTVNGFNDGATGSTLPSSVTCTVTDQVGLSGPVNASPTPAVDDDRNSNGVGPVTYTCNGADNATNTNSASKTFTVSHSGVSGILQPINPDNTSVFSRGRAVPVKFQLGGDGAGTSFLSGFNTSGWTLQRVQVNCTSFDADDATLEPVPSNTPTTIFRYDSTADQYIYNADFKSAAAGTCWKVKVTLDDGTTVLYSAIFKMQK